MPSFFEAMTKESKEKWQRLAKELGSEIRPDKFTELEPEEEIAELMQMTDSEIKERYG